MQPVSTTSLLPLAPLLQRLHPLINLLEAPRLERRGVQERPQVEPMIIRRVLLRVVRRRGDSLLVPVDLVEVEESLDL